MRTELKLGIFAIAVIIILSYMTLKVSGLGVPWKKGYRLYVMFDNVSGLDEKSRVKVAGVDAGVVGEVGLKGNKAKLTLLIMSDIKIYEDAKASLRVSGLLGDKYLALWAGNPSKQPLNDGDWIINTEPAADIDALANQLSSAASYISELAEGLQDVFGTPERKAIKETIHNLRDITANFNDILKEDKEPLHNLLVSLENFSKKLGDKGPGLVDDLSEIAGELRELIEENRQAVQKSVQNIQSFSESAEKIAQKIEKGEGTFGKLLKDERLYDSFSSVAEGAGKSFDVIKRLSTFMDFRTEYLTEEGEWKGYFDLTLKPRRDTYYILGVVTDPVGESEITDITVDGVTTRREVIERKIEFTAQFAKRFEDFVLRVGMLENTFGIGADYFLNNDRVKIGFNVWDFNADEAYADSAHMKIGVDFRIFKHIFISGGLDNLLNKSRRGIYIGGGLGFEDEDLKYMFGLLP